MNGDVRVEKVLEAARLLFLKDGVRHTSVESIARRVGIAKGSVYLAFPSKDAICVALMRRLTEGYLQGARKALAAETEIARAVTAYLEAAVGIPGRTFFSQPQALELARHRGVRAEGIVESYEAALVEDLEAVVRVAGLPPETTRQMIAAAHGCLAVAGGREDEFRALLAELVATLLAGIRQLPQPDALSAMPSAASGETPADLFAKTSEKVF